MNVAEVVGFVETAGAVFRIDRDKVRLWYPNEAQREKLAEHVAFLRSRKPEVTEFLRKRGAIPLMPPGVRLLSWNLKEPPIVIEYHAVVTDPAKFARVTLRELRVRLSNPKRKYGWSVEQLIDRLSQVGVEVALEYAEMVNKARP